MNTDRHFSPALLLDSEAHRLAYFEGLWIVHPYLEEALSRLERLLRLNGAGHLIVLNGPTGSGKTRLCEMVLAECIDAAHIRMEAEPEHVPGFMVELAANHDGRFDWRDHFYRSLTQLEEPLLDRKVVPNEITSSLEWGTERVLRQAYENCLKYRNVELAIWDEAHHLRKVAGSRAYVEQMDAIKSIANLTGTLHLLAGTYEILDLCDLSAELARRTYDVHLPRYGETSRDQKIFANVVRSLQVHLPVAAQSDLHPLAEYLYERSLGCIGILKEWLAEALLVALDEGSSSVSEKQLRQTGYAAGKLLAIRREIEVGEARRWEIDGMGAEPPPTASTFAVRSAFGRRPGVRLPVRDAVSYAKPAM